MNIQIQAIHFAADQQLKGFINKKVEKLISIDDSIINADIYLKVDKPESHDNKIVEIKIHASDGEFFAKKQSNLIEIYQGLLCQSISSPNFSSTC